MFNHQGLIETLSDVEIRAVESFTYFGSQSTPQIKDIG